MEVTAEKQISSDILMKSTGELSHRKKEEHLRVELQKYHDEEHAYPICIRIASCFGQLYSVPDLLQHKE